MFRKSIFSLVILISVSLALGLVGAAKAQGGYDPSVQTQALLYNEASAVYLGNLARRDNGVPPLRWNRQLTQAARWFSWDSTENQPDGFCGHQDTQGNWPDHRARAFGYLGGAGAENAFCGFLSPADAIQGWMSSSGHRGNLLDPNSREIGLGYYQRSGDERGYVTQDFGNDPVYAPVVIENEALSTTNPDVNLYVYDRSTGGGFAGLGAATQMMVSNHADFSGAAWESYSADKAWALPGGEGWRDVYVKTRDVFNRTLTASDSIYLGANAPLNELGDAQMSATQSQVTLYNLDGGALPQAQFSLGWLADDTFGTFSKWWGNGGRVNDAAAWGGTAYRLYPGDGESFAWVYDTTFIKDTPLVAYFRLKVNNNTSSSEVARISVKGGGTEYGPLTLRGTDFAAPNQYQEFPVNFTFNTNPDDVFLTFQFWRSGSADVYFDAISIFSAPQAVTSPMTWAVPGNNYRGQGVWVRYTDGSQFSAITEAATVPAPYTISGNVGLAGVTLSYTDGALKTTLSDGNGNYTIAVPGGWGGSVTPSHSFYTFDPPARAYSNVDADQTAQDYTAAPTGAATPTPTPTISPTGTPAPVTATFTSVGAYDGWILESSESSSAGGAQNNTAAYFIVGDDASNRQYRGLLYFDTSALPDNAVITSVALKIKKQGLVGVDPFSTHGKLLVDLRKPFFGVTAGLAKSDFQAIADKLPAAAFLLRAAPVNGWYSVSIGDAAYPSINLGGSTQFRLRFTKDDDNDRKVDYVRFYSGEAPAASRPQLIVTYGIP